jgi:peptide/nickel transport system substrate-binding protein
MKRIVCHFRVRNNLLAAAVMLAAMVALSVASVASASRRPQTGGTLRVQISERLPTIDPRQWPGDSMNAAAVERVESLIFDRLVRLDEHGNVQPALAISWQHDAQSKSWQFRLRDGVKFTDGSPLTPTVAALALQQLLGASFDVSATPDSVVILAEHSLPDLPLVLATGRYFVFHSADDDSLIGTGPFRVEDWFATSASSKATLTANLSCWAGRPFVNKIELAMGVDFQQQANAISFGQADIVELPASQVRRTAQRGVLTASSDPVDLFALVFDASRPAVQDTRLRQAISLGIDRASIADVILQRQAIVAGSLLPNWISGYAHLFSAAADLPRARDLLAASAQAHFRSMPLVLIYDSSDAEARAVADRVVVNLRELGIMVQVFGKNVDGKTKPPTADFSLVREHIAAPDASMALSELLHSMGESPAGMETPEQIYAAERSPIDAFHVIPLVHISESYGLSPQLRDWMPSRWGGWRLEDVWLGPPATNGGSAQ